MSLRSGNRGFVLIGVIIFVLALSILGMSLYAVSGYEAAFLGQSHDDNGALYSAQGGLDMVRELLAVPPYRMAIAHSIEDTLGIVSARAWQRMPGGAINDTGVVDFASDSAVTVVVTARAGSQSRQIQASYLPHFQRDFYRRLFTLSGTSLRIWPPQWWPGSVYIDWLTGTTSATVEMGPDTPVLQHSADQSWTSRVIWDATPSVGVDTIPAPDVSGYYASHPTAYAAVEAPNGTGHSLTFTAHTAGTIGYYRSPQPAGDYSYYESGSTLDLYVEGTVVWELPLGFRCDGVTTVHSVGGPATLVIVGSPNLNRVSAYSDPYIGLWFFSGLNVQSGVSVVLASDGQVNVERNNSAYGNVVQSASALAVYCPSVFLGGPVNGRSVFDHPESMDAIIADLESADALPQPRNAAPQGFTMVRGSWQDTTP